MKFDFPDEDVMKLDDYDGVNPEERWTLTFDGASNTAGHGIGEILTSPCKLIHHLLPSYISILRTMWQNMKPV